MMYTRKHRLSMITAGLLVLLLLMMSACKELSNDPPENAGTLVVNLGDIQKQVGVSASGSSASAGSLFVEVPGTSNATDQVRSLLVGAFVVTKRDTPYSRTMAMTDEVEEDIQDDLAASVDYIKIITLPTENDYIEFFYPKSELSRWQVIAVALNFEIKEFAELGEDAHEDAVLYMGFSENFYTASAIEGVEEVTVEMARACLLNPVKGCATYGADVGDEPVVTSAVEILGVRYNEETSDYIPSNNQFPYIVRDGNESDAIDYLEEIRGDIAADLGGIDQIDSLTVRTTHTGNDTETVACQNLYNASPGVGDLDGDATPPGACNVQENTIGY